MQINIDKNSIANSDRISVTFEISPDKREHLLKLVTGENNTEKFK